MSRDTRGTATIAAGASLSNTVDLRDGRLVAMVMPATWTAAGITFAAAATPAGPFNPVYDDAGNEATVIAEANRVIGVDTLSGVLAPLRFVQLRSGTSGVPVNQVAAAAITLLLKA